MSEELEYLDSDLEYTVPVISKKLYHVSLSTALNGNHDIKLTYDNNKSDYAEGDTVSINCDRIGSYGGESVGWCPTSVKVSDQSQRNDIEKFPSYESILVYKFTMPAEDVTVYSYCPGGGHESSTTAPAE